MSALKFQRPEAKGQIGSRGQESSFKEARAPGLKTGLWHLAFIWILAFGFWNFRAVAAPPALTADKAAKIAQEQLTSRNLQGKHHVSSLVLEKTSFTSKEVRWVATFTPGIPLGDRKEIGVEIGMDGSTVRLVDKAAKE
jgi:hypothetical protein